MLHVSWTGVVGGSDSAPSGPYVQWAVYSPTPGRISIHRDLDNFSFTILLRAFFLPRYRLEAAASYDETQIARRYQAQVLRLFVQRVLRPKPMRGISIDTYARSTKIDARQST